MNMYIVCWPDRSTSIVTAQDEDELRRMLSARADPAQCRWRNRSGHLWVDLIDDETEATPAVRGALPRIVEEGGALRFERAEIVDDGDGPARPRWAFDRVLPRGEA